MTPEQRPHFDDALDSLANVLHVEPLNEMGKAGYFRSLQGNSFEMFIEGLKHVEATYVPRWRNDFPAPAIISNGIQIACGVAAAGMPESKPEELYASLKNRGYLVGEEAVREFERRKREQEQAE